MRLLLCINKLITNSLLINFQKKKVIVAEKNSFSNIAEIENQRIILHCHYSSTII